MDYYNNFLGLGKAAKKRKTEKRTYRKEKKQLRLESKKAKIESKKAETKINESQSNVINNLENTPVPQVKAKNKNFLIIGIVAGVVVMILIIAAIAFKKTSN